MSNSYIFDSKATFTDKDLFTGHEPALVQHWVKDEPMFWRASVDLAFANGDFLTRSFIFELMRYPEWAAVRDTILIDSRVHMLFPGWYPSIPGYHFDDVPRELPNKQPNHRNPSYKAEHAMMLVGDASLTQFALGTAEFPEVGPDDLYYQKWHPIVEQYVKDGVLESRYAEPNKLIFFDWNTWHQGVKATKRGNRLFIRATRNTNLKMQNEIRRNAQVYLENPMEGW